MELKIRIERDKSDVRNAISSIDDMIVLRRIRIFSLCLETFATRKILFGILSDSPASAPNWTQNGDIDFGDRCWTQKLLVTSLRCWWPNRSDRSKMLVTDLLHWKITKLMKKVANIRILSSISQIGHHHKITNLTLSPSLSHSKPLSPSKLFLSILKRRKSRSNWMESPKIQVISGLIVISVRDLWTVLSDAFDI